VTDTNEDRARLVVSRSYYAMYQAARRLVFAISRRDVDDHRDLPKHLPENFPNRQHWQGRLKFWRVKRNKVDYSPYPPEGDDVTMLGESAAGEAAEFCAACRQYLNERGIT